jgi:RNA polymerase sigma-70 factor, ECF subfamily
LTNKNLNLGGPGIDPTTLVRWIRKAKKGDIGSYQKIYDLFARKVLNFIYRMVNSAEEAEDLTQETFIAVYQKLGSLKDDNKFEPWLFRIARNFVYQRYRTRPPATVSVDAVDEDGQPVTQLVDARKNPDESFQANELEGVVEEVIAGLPEKYREVFVLSAVQHLSYQQIAEVVGRSLPSVKTDIHRARLEVRKRVKEYLKV